MKKALCLTLLLGFLVLVPQAAEQAQAASNAIASNSAAHSVGSGTIKLTAVTLATGPDSGTFLTPVYNSKSAIFYLKNFGTKTLNGFSVTQTDSSSVLRYCVGQAFQPGSSTVCADGTNAVSAGTGTTTAVFTTPLPPGMSYVFSSQVQSGNSSNRVDISVGPSNITSTISRS